MTCSEPAAPYWTRDLVVIAAESYRRSVTVPGSGSGMKTDVVAEAVGYAVAFAGVVAAVACRRPPLKGVALDIGRFVIALLGKWRGMARDAMAW